jgi:hypothetical protein
MCKGKKAFFETRRLFIIKDKEFIIYIEEQVVEREGLRYDKTYRIRYGWNIT